MNQPNVLLSEEQFNKLWDQSQGSWRKALREIDLVLENIHWNLFDALRKNIFKNQLYRNDVKPSIQLIFDDDAAARAFFDWWESTGKKNLYCKTDRDASDTEGLKQGQFPRYLRITGKCTESFLVRKGRWKRMSI